MQKEEKVDESVRIGRRTTWRPAFDPSLRSDTDTAVPDWAVVRQLVEHLQLL